MPLSYRQNVGKEPQHPSMGQPQELSSAFMDIL